MVAAGTTSNFRPLINESNPYYYGSNTGQPIYAPTRTDLGTAYQNVQKTGILPSAASTQIQGFGDDYYSNIFDQSKKRLEKSYFTSDNSLSKQMTNQMAKRGLVGSGIEAGATNQLYSDFGSQLADVEANLSTERAKNDLDTQKFNIGNQFNLAQLGLSAAGDEARNATTFDTSIFESSINYEKAQAEKLAAAIESMSSLIGNKDVHENDRESYSEALADYLRSVGLYLPETVSQG